MSRRSAGRKRNGLGGYEQNSIRKNQMKTLQKLLTIALISASTAQAAETFYKTGQVFCDANTNGVIDTGDTPVQSVLVVVTNLSGTFSNSGWTSIDGYFVID